MITLNNYEEYLIDYLHGELDENAVTQMEGFLDKHPDIRHEFELLKQTIITPDNDIVFADKHLLLKPAADSFFIRYRAQLAAAAMLTGIVLSVLFLYHKPEGVSESQVKVLKTAEEGVVLPSDTIMPGEANKQQVVAAIQKSEKNAPEMRKKSQIAPAVKRISGTKNIQLPKEPEKIARQTEYNKTDEDRRMEMPIVKTETDSSPIPEKAVQIMTPDNNPTPIASSSHEKNTYELNKQKQPKLFRAIAQVVKLSRKIKNKKESIANTEITVIVGNKKVINLN